MSDGTLNFPTRATPPDAPNAGRYKIWVDSTDGKPKITDENGVTTTFEAVYGQNFGAALNEADETNNTTTFDEYALLNYDVSTISGFVIYEVNLNIVWGYSVANQDFRGRLLLNGVQFGEEFRQEPKDAGADQRHYTSLTFPVFGFQLATLTGSLAFEYAASTAGNIARMFYCYLTIKRVA